MTTDDSSETLAPHVEADWRDDFVVELRIQGASGVAIADALLEVEVHCRESGHSATHAFGPAAEYAKALELPDESHWTRADLARTWAQLLLYVGGFWLALWGGIALLKSEQAELAVGDLVIGGVTLIVMMLVFKSGTFLMRFAIEHTGWFSVCFGATLMLTLLAGLPFRNTHLASFNAPLPFVTGVAAILTAIVITMVLRKTGRSLADPIVAPNMPGTPESTKTAL